MKNFIKNKKLIITFISCLVVVILAFIGVTAMKMIAKDSSIGSEAAKKFALLDAGVQEKNIEDIDVQFDYKDSAYVYNVDFETQKKEYHYYVKASNGIILEKKIIKKKKHKKKKDKKESKKKKTNKSKKSKKKKGKSKSSSKSEKKIKETTKKVKSKKNKGSDNVDEVIGLDQAKSIAISSSGESPGDVIFTIARLNGDEYDLQFYNGNKEYNYSIDAFSGSVISGYSNTLDERDSND